MYVLFYFSWNLKIQHLAAICYHLKNFSNPDFYNQMMGRKLQNYLKQQTLPTTRNLINTRQARVLK